MARIVPRGLFRAIAAAGVGVIPVLGAEACEFGGAVAMGCIEDFDALPDALPDASAGRDVIRLNEDASTNDARDARMVADSAFGDESDVGTLEGGDVAAEAGHDAGGD
jgi:hypothetical protein